MIAIMKKGAARKDVAAAVRLIEEMGYKAHVSRGDEKTVIGMIGEFQDGIRERLLAMAAVDDVVVVSKPYKLASREFHPSDTVIKVKGNKIGGGGFVVMAGPCSVESREQIIQTAQCVRDHGGHILRGGAFKPRTSPHAFQGLGVRGLEYLAEAREKTGLPVVTEVLSPTEVALVAQYADILQIGARNMQNFALLNAVSTVRKPVLLKRGMMATIEEFLLAAEYILKGGNTEVILCERGIRTFESATRNTLDISAAPLIQRLSHLPIILDPSHATGKRDLVPPLARAALAVGADGVIVEIHPEPEKAKSDGPQSLHLKTFAAMMDDLTTMAHALGRNIKRAPRARSKTSPAAPTAYSRSAPIPTNHKR